MAAGNPLWAADIQNCLGSTPRSKQNQADATITGHYHINRTLGRSKHVTSAAKSASHGLDFTATVHAAP